MNSKTDVMNNLVKYYNKVKGKGNWAQKRDIATIFDKTKGTFYLHFNRTADLWEHKKEGLVVLVRPIEKWDDLLVQESDYTNQNPINLMCDTIIHIENTIEKCSRLNQMLNLVSILDEDSIYKGMRDDIKERINTLKETCLALELVA